MRTEAAVRRLSVAFATLCLGCGDGSKAPSNVTTPGAPASAKTRTLEAGTAFLQQREPVEKLNVYLNGFHFYAGNLGAQMEAHHFCAVMNEEAFQCVIYDGSGRDAKIMGVEYIISRRLFETLPADEQKLWHSHVHEIRSGQLIAPGVPAPAEREFMEKLVDIYGKTCHTWHTDRQLELPVGHPMLMMGFTADGQVNEAMVESRDRRLGVSSQERRAERASLPAPTPAAGADAWQRGGSVQLTLVPQRSGACAVDGHASHDATERR
jgi:hypothetical protein